MKVHSDERINFTVTNKRTPTPADYTLHGYTLASVSADWRSGCAMDSLVQASSWGAVRGGLEQ